MIATSVPIATFPTVHPPLLPVPLAHDLPPMVTIAPSTGPVPSVTVTAISTVSVVSASLLSLLEAEFTPLQCSQRLRIKHLLGR